MSYPYTVPDSISQRTAYVSGGGSGIGRETARTLVHDGWEVVVFGRDPDRLAETAALAEEDGRDPVLSIGRQGGRVHTVAADLSDPGQVEDAVERAARLAGLEVTAVVNAAGGTSALPSGTLAETAAEWLDEFRINVLTAVLLTTAVFPKLSRPNARIVTISSIAAQRGGGSYGAAKAALHPWTWDLGTRLGADGTANVVAPGYVEDTGFFRDSMTGERRERLLAQTANGRAGTPRDVAETVRWLLSPAAQHVTRQLIPVNGGALTG